MHTIEQSVAITHSVLPRAQEVISMCKILEQYNDKIKGTFSFFDRIIINGYINPLMNEYSRANALYQLGILYKNYKDYFSNVTDSIKKGLKKVPLNQAAPSSTCSLPKAGKRISQKAKWTRSIPQMV